MNNQLVLPYKLYIPFPELINPDYQYAVRTTQNGSSTYIIKVRTNLSQNGTPCDNTNTSATCMTYDIHYSMGTYFYSINSGQNANTAFQTFSLFPYDKITNDFWYAPQFKDSLVMFFIIMLVCVYLPYKLFSRLFGRWLKL